MVVCRPVRRQDDCADLQVLYVPGTSETDLADTGNALKTALLDFMPELVSLSCVFQQSELTDLLGLDRATVEALICKRQKPFFNHLKSNFLHHNR